MVKVKPTTYEPFGEELSASVALIQAATTLDAATYLAVESKNVSKLLDIAAMWIGLSERLTIEVDEDDEDESDESPSDKRSFGFSGNHVSQVDEPTKEVIAEDA